MAGCSKGPGASGIDASMMDRSVPAQRDLYRHMNGTWLQKFDIPADKSNYGAFSKLADDAEKNLRSIIDEAARTSPKENGSPAQKVGDMYASFMDSARIEQIGLDAIRADLQAIAAVKTPAELTDLAGKLRGKACSAPSSNSLARTKRTPRNIS